MHKKRGAIKRLKVEDNRSWPEGVRFEDIEAAGIENLARLPEVVADIKKLASENSVSFQAACYDLLAHGYRYQGRPVPPKIIDYLAEHAPRLLKPLLD